MDKQDALKIVADMGEGYFLDWVHDYESIEIGVKIGMTRVKEDASHSMPAGPSSWRAEEEAARIVFQDLELDVQDQILTFYFGIYPEDVGGSRAFFERLYMTIKEGISEAKMRS